jgi:transposase-like protein
MKLAMDLMKLMEAFDTEAECRQYLEELRWPKGISCPRCCGTTISRLSKRDQFDCDSCRYQFSVMSGTIFHDSHLELPKWFAATYIICESRKGMSANQIKRMLGISYKTAWYLCHRIRKAMADTNPEKLTGTIEVDETYVGGRPPRGSKPGRGTPKEVVIGIRQRGGDLRFFHAQDAKSGTLEKYIRESVATDEVDVMITDEYTSYPGAMKRTGLTAKHKTIKHKSRIYVEGDIHTNTVESAFSLLKRGIIGTWHRISAKHLSAYLQEMTWRFNNRKNVFLFRDTMLKLIQSGNLEYKTLVNPA